MEVTVRSVIIRVVVTTIALTGSVLPAAGQERPAGDVAFGYALLKDSDVDGVFGAGWVASAAGRVSRSFDVVGEVGGSYKGVGAQPVGFESTLRIHSFSGGPRYVTRPAPNTSVFVQALVGAARVSFGIESCGSLPAEICALAREADLDRTFFMIQPGFGVDVAMTKRTGIRLTTDYRAVRATASEFDETEILHEFRFGAGIVFKFG
jgi:hypothetical protein